MISFWQTELLWCVGFAINDGNGTAAAVADQGDILMWSKTVWTMITVLMVW